MTLQGTDASVVRQAIDDRDPFPGTRGFAGVVDDTLLRDVLGRYPLYVERDANDAGEGPGGDAWAFDHRDLDDPVLFPAGTVRREGTDERVWTLPDPDPVPEADALDALRAALEGSFEAVDTDGTAVAFSGGVDSALVAAALEAPLYVAGFPDSHDVEAAKSGAEALGLDLTVVAVTHDDLRRAVPEVVDAVGRTNAMDVQIALPLYLTAERAAADGFDRLAVGQGADELFGGYAKVAKAPEDPRTDADTVRGATREVIGSLPDQLPRDVCALRAAGVEPVAPLLHDGVVAAALRLPESLLVEGDTRKVALRRVAREWLPDEIADRDKKAVQYGSLIARELDRLARQNGFKRRMDDHVSKYVESLVDGN
jgi:asparagine synthase (glutamine-hydrolysing)